jgi:hypothetical protein
MAPPDWDDPAWETPKLAAHANNKGFVLDARMEAGDWETRSFYSRNRIRSITTRMTWRTTESEEQHCGKRPQTTKEFLS